MLVIMMMMIHSTVNGPISDPFTTFPSWKLYDNPFYISQNHHHNQIDLPIAASSSFLDLRLIKPVMDSELDFARTQIMELKSELEFERNLRKKMDSVNKTLVKELFEERKGREMLERECEESAKELSLIKDEMNRMRREMEKERKMLRMAEVFREERVQMKLNEAKILLEEKLLEFEENQRLQIPRKEEKIVEDQITHHLRVEPSSINRLILREKQACIDNSTNGVDASIQRRASPEAENHHIRRGIKGFVEFPRVVRAIGSKNKIPCTKLECQKAQLRVLLKQNSPIRSNNITIS